MIVLHWRMPRLQGHNHRVRPVSLRESESNPAISSHGNLIPRRSRHHIATAYIGHRITDSNFLIYMHVHVNVLFIVNSRFFFCGGARLTFDANKSIYFIAFAATFFFVSQHSLLTSCSFLSSLPSLFPISYPHPPLGCLHRGASLLHHCMPAVR